MELDRRNIHRKIRDARQVRKATKAEQRFTPKPKAVEKPMMILNKRFVGPRNG